MIDLAEKAKSHAQGDVSRAQEALELEKAKCEDQLVEMRKAVQIANDEKLALSAQLEEAQSVHEELKKQHEAMEADLVETCTLLEKVSAKANDSTDDYKKLIAEMNQSMETMKHNLEDEVVLAVELTGEKELVIKQLQTRERELEAQLAEMHNGRVLDASRLATVEAKLKDATVGERERLAVLKKENARLEKRLKDTWTALQGAHAVVEQTKTAAKEAVRKANLAASRAEKVAIKAREELTTLRGKMRIEEDHPKLVESIALPSMPDTASPIKPREERSRNASFDDEMQRASDLLERLTGRSRESSLRDETESIDALSEASAGYGYRGAKA
jgi:chromosome segregation ATPase